MRQRVIAVIGGLVLGVVAALPRPSAAAALVKECSPPGGVWGVGNAFRSKIQVFADNTAVYMSQNVATTAPGSWFRAPFPAGGGSITNGVGTQNTIVAEGDGYKVTAQGRSNYNAHFACAAAAPTKP